MMKLLTRNWPAKAVSLAIAIATWLLINSIQQQDSAPPSEPLAPAFTPAPPVPEPNQSLLP